MSLKLEEIKKLIIESIPEEENSSKDSGETVDNNNKGENNDSISENNGPNANGETDRTASEFTDGEGGGE